jgi:SagB-type dehydrogenase family enzyme
MNDAAPMRALLAATALGADWDDGAEPPARSTFELDRGNQPSPLKSYPGARTRRLTRKLLRSPLSAIDVLSGHRPASLVLDEDRLAAILFLAGGITRGRRTSAGAPVWFRTAMSAGNLHPLELYVIGGGVWHYDPLLHRLELVRAGDENEATEGVTLVLTGIPARTCWKYAARGFRHLFWDAGTLLANLLAAADAYGVDSSVSLGFDDAEVAALLAIEAPEEVPLALVALGSTPPGLDEGGLGPAAVARPITRVPIRFDLVTAALEESWLSAADVGPWRDRLRVQARVEPMPTTPLPPTDGASTEDVILRRGSSRRFRSQAGSESLFNWVLAVGALQPALDVAESGTHVGQLVHVHDVSGIEPGIWDVADGRRLLSTEEPTALRQQSARCCLNQDLGRDSSLTAFATADLEALFDYGGGRAFRVAGIEAGILAGRLALGATAIGAGATGLTFVDELVAAELGHRAAGVLACALGNPATPPAPHGSPGAPHRL